MRKVLKFSLVLTALLLLFFSFLKSSFPAATGRFVDNGDGTVSDTKRQIMWQKGDNGEEVSFDQARTYCVNLRLGNHDDWRLPNPEEPDTETVVELMMPVHSSLPYVRFDLYWSSEPSVLLPFNYRPARGAEVLRAYPAGKGDRAYVRAVRSMRKR